VFVLQRLFDEALKTVCRSSGKGYHKKSKRAMNNRHSVVFINFKTDCIAQWNEVPKNPNNFVSHILTDFSMNHGNTTLGCTRTTISLKKIRTQKYSKRVSNLWMDTITSQKCVTEKNIS